MADQEKKRAETNEEPADEVQPDAVDAPETTDATDTPTEDPAPNETGDDPPPAVPPDLLPAPDPDEQPKGADDTTSFDDDKTDKAIDEIIAKEGDDLLAVQDAAAAKGGVAAKRHGGGFWRSKWLRSILLLLVIGGLVAVAAVPSMRYWALNTAGVRSSSSIVIVDNATQLPLKGVHVSLGGQKKDTDSDGKAAFTNLRLGPAQLTITQAGFGSIKRDLVIGWGSNPFGTFALKATGVQFVIEVRDYLSDKPIEGVEATGQQASATSGKDGKITLTLENAVVTQDGIALSKAGYRTDNITLNADLNKPTKATLVPDRKTVFVTKESGKYDLYKSYVDGKNREVLLKATGSENSNIALAMSPDGSRVAYVSTRDNKHDSGGFLLSSLTLINVENGNITTIAESPQIQLIDWIGSRLIFQTGAADSSAQDRYAVVSYNATDNTRLQLATANKLNAVISAKGLIYYAVGADPAKPAIQLGLFKIGPDGKGSQRVFDIELATVLRSTYTSLSVQAEEGTWYTYDLASGAKTQITTPPSLASRLYADNDGRTKSLWVGQGKLLMFDVAAGKDTDLAAQSGLAYPVQWLGPTTAVYRVSSGSETADYAVSADGGSPHKIADVAATYGFAQAQ